MYIIKAFTMQFLTNWCDINEQKEWVNRIVIILNVNYYKGVVIRFASIVTSSFEMLLSKLYFALLL